MAADDTIHPEIPHLEVSGGGPRKWNEGHVDHRVSGYERALSSRGFTGPKYVRMTINLSPLDPAYRELTELLQSIGIDPADADKLRAADRSYAAYVRAQRIATVEARFIADGNASLLHVEKLPAESSTNPIGKSRRKKR